MAGGLTQIERRKHCRVGPGQTPWQGAALLWPGQDVQLMNIGAGGALIVSQAPIAPGARAELQVLGRDRRRVSGRIERCRVHRLEPIGYEAAMVFDRLLDVATRTKGQG